MIRLTNTIIWKAQSLPFCSLGFSLCKLANLFFKFLWMSQCSYSPSAFLSLNSQSVFLCVWMRSPLSECGWELGIVIVFNEPHCGLCHVIGKIWIKVHSWFDSIYIAYVKLSPYVCIYIYINIYVSWSKNNHIVVFVWERRWEHAVCGCIHPACLRAHESQTEKISLQLQALKMQLMAVIFK